MNRITAFTIATVLAVGAFTAVAVQANNTKVAVEVAHHTFSAAEQALADKITGTPVMP